MVGVTLDITALLNVQDFALAVDARQYTRTRPPYEVAVIWTRSPWPPEEGFVGAGSCTSDGLCWHAWRKRG